MPPKVYCGKKVVPPAGSVKGTSSACYKKGVAIGALLLENHQSLETLTKDIVREYAAKLKIPRYSTMTKPELIQAIRDTGKYREGIQAKTWYQ